jgi:hypothetical protein
MLSLVCGCNRVPVVFINDPCNTFVSEFAPNRTPALQRTDDGRFTLEISFTPAKNNREADKIVSAVQQHPVELRITKTKRSIQALRLGRGSMVVSVASKEEAESILEELCFNKTNLVVAEPLRVR